MKKKTKSSLLLSILTLGTVLGFFAVTFGITRASGTILVSPSGGDDTANIQAAFDAAGPGDIVQLTAGQFYTNAIYVEDFCGSLKGAGKDETLIDVLKGLDPTDLGLVGPGGFPHIFTFIGGDVCISDLGFEITPFEPAAEWLDPNFPEDKFYDVLSPILIAGDVDSRVENIKVKGHDGTAIYDPWHPLYMLKGYNVRVGVILGSPEVFCSGNHIITNCEFDSIWLGCTGYRWEDSEIKIHSNSIKGNAIGIISVENHNSVIEITDNYIESNAYGGVWVMKFAPPATKWIISRNTIRTSILTDGILLQDFTGLGALEAVVSHNKIILEDNNFGGIWTSWLQDARIYGNSITGTGDYGMGCAFTENSLFCGNRISNSGSDGMFFYQSSQNFIVGNTLSRNGGWGLVMVESNDNCIVCNLFYKNGLGNIFDEGTNTYKWNWEY
jgi:parallel beta-helix repeat protein